MTIQVLNCNEFVHARYSLVKGVVMNINVCSFIAFRHFMLRDFANMRLPPHPMPRIKIHHSCTFKASRIKNLLHLEKVFVAYCIMLKELKNKKEGVLFTVFLQRKEQHSKVLKHCFLGGP